TTDLAYDTANPVDDRYAPPDCGELAAFGEILLGGRLSGGAPVLAEYEHALARWFGATCAVAVNSGSSALHATPVALDVKPGTLGTAGCFSTHDRKLLSTGEGGFVLTDNEELAERIDHYTHLGHLKGRVHGVNYKLAAPLASIGLRRLTHLQAQLDARRRNARRVIDALPAGGILRELGYPAGDQPNYYNLVLTTTERQPQLAERRAAIGLPPDSIRYHYRPLYQQP